MNRIEVLLEALKETDKLLVAMVESRSQASVAPANEAAERIEEITAAILAEKNDELPGINTHPEVPSLEVLMSRKDRGDLLDKISDLTTERNIFARELTKAKEELDLAKAVCALSAPTNPALESVLAKLRILPPLYIESHDNYPVCDTLTLGDLRRWVESEVKP